MTSGASASATGTAAMPSWPSGWITMPRGSDAIGHNGAPTLHYPGHGQLWSRYPVQQTRLKPGVSIRQKNAYLVFAYDEGAGRRIEDLRHRLLHPVEVTADRPPRVESARGSGALARPGETGDIAPIKAAIWQALRGVRDEQLYTADANSSTWASVRRAVAARHRPHRDDHAAPRQARPRLPRHPGGRPRRCRHPRAAAEARRGPRRRRRPDLEPPWTPARLTDAGRRALGPGAT